MKTLQKFGSIHAQRVHNHFNQERHLVTRVVYNGWWRRNLCWN